MFNSISCIHNAYRNERLVYKRWVVSFDDIVVRRVRSFFQKCSFVSFFKLIFGLLNGWLSFNGKVLRISHCPFLLGGTWRKYRRPALWFVMRTRGLPDLCETLAWNFFQATSLHSKRAPCPIRRKSNGDVLCDLNFVCCLQ